MGACLLEMLPVLSGFGSCQHHITGKSPAFGWLMLVLFGAQQHRIVLNCRVTVAGSGEDVVLGRRSVDAWSGFLISHHPWDCSFH